MKIRTLAQLSIGAVLTGMMAIAIVALHASQRLADIAIKRNSIYQVTQGAGEMRLLAHEAMLHPDERPQMQWQWKYQTLNRLLAHISFDDPLAANILTSARDNLNGANEAFIDSIALRAALAKEPQSRLLQARRDMILVQLSVHLQSLLSKTSQLRQLVSDADLKVRNESMNLLFGLLDILAIISVVSGAMIMNRMAIPITRLREGTAIIGSGNLAYHVGTQAKDEIGELSREIDRMAKRLTEVTASRDELERETCERIRVEAQMNFLAHHDALTALPNRILLEDRLEQAIVHVKRTDKKVALLFLDLDRFKNINDTCGHLMGDAVLRCLADRLRQSIRDADTLSRLGGDEFVILLPEIDHHEVALEVGHKLLTAMNTPFRIEDQEFNLSFSIGIALFPDHSCDRESLMKNADIAMYCAKENGRNSLVLYNKKLSDSAEHRSLMENDLRRAIKGGELQLYYQPQINIQTNKIVGLEALLRWHNDGKWIMPATFVPVAEETGLIASIGEWVISEACMQIRKWKDLGLPTLPVAINVSAAQLAQKNFAENIFKALAGNGVSPETLKIELTESMIMQGSEHIMTLLETLRKGGIQLAIDDFGTGYSSLSYLKRFPIETLKIDQSFIRGLPDDPDDVAITKAIIRMAQSLRLNVIAEGVESMRQMEFLRGNQCLEIQGNFFSRPQPPHSVASFLLAHYAHYGYPRNHSSLIHFQ